MRRFTFAYAILFLISTGALAQQRPAESAGSLINVTVVKLDNQKLTVKTDKGTELSAIVPAAVRVLRLRPGTIADIKSSQYIHSMTMDEPGGKLRAETVAILPDAVRDWGGGHHPRPGGPNASFTSGNIDEVSGAGDGRTIKVSYKGGQSEIMVPQDAKVTVTQLASREDIKPGTQIGLFAKESPPGTWTALSINITQ